MEVKLKFSTNQLIKTKNKMDYLMKNQVVKNKNWRDVMNNQSLYNEQFLKEKEIDNQTKNFNLLKINNVKDLSKIDFDKEFKIDIGNTNSTFCSNNDLDILFKCLKEIEDNETKSFNYKESLFYKYLKKSKYKSFNELHKITEESNLNNVSKYSNVYPWIFNLNQNISKFDGELSDSIIEMHFLKLKRLIFSIKNFGYIQNNFKDKISGFFLENNSKLTFLVTRGIHRLLVLKYFNLEIIAKIDKNFNKIYDIKNSLNWEIVNNNFVSKEIAEKIFQYYMV